MSPLPRDLFNTPSQALGRLADLAAHRARFDKHRRDQVQRDAAIIQEALAAAARPTEAEVRIHARWHRTLDDPYSAPEGPIKDHVLQVLRQAYGAGYEARDQEVS